MVLQNIIVWLIVATAALVTVRWLWRIVCSLRHGNAGGCASCASQDCPLRSMKIRK